MTFEVRKIVEKNYWYFIIFTTLWWYMWKEIKN